ncbi:hypothetical protein S40293_08086 [Stachybotrys chartarum IBT 40293]|nr:hypothetical protein S40293_08086 [Stachybotrys chartarum IBT 40293]
MATATILASGASYQTQQPYAPAYSHPPGPSISNMISPTEPRKPVDGNDTLNRQSLPSLSEVISGAKPGQLPPPGPPGPPTMQPGSGLPSPFVPAQRHYPEADKHSPQSIHPTASFPRSEHPSTFTDSPRVPFNGRPGLPPVSDRRPSPPTKHELPPHHLHESQKTAEPHHVNGGYSHPPPPAASYPPSQLPPGQVPLPAYPISPGHAVHHINGPYDPRASGVHPEEHDYQSRARYDANGNRHFEAWSYQDTLGRVGASSRTIYHFAEAYGRIAQEQQGPHYIQERLPTEREMADMLANAEMLKRSLDQLRDLVMVSIQSAAREGAKPKGPYDDDQDVPMYAEGKPPYSMPDVKRRRGRAAPPGRCHSCNRVDTPEWRRGPDGARTLCNACGLHYAKLERKRQLEARSIRPKPEDRA